MTDQQKFTHEDFKAALDCANDPDFGRYCAIEKYKSVVRYALVAMADMRGGLCRLSKRRSPGGMIMSYYRIINQGKYTYPLYETQVLRDGGEWKSVQSGTLEQCKEYKRQLQEITKPTTIEIVEEYEA